MICIERSSLFKIWNIFLQRILNFRCGDLFRALNQKVNYDPRRDLHGVTEDHFVGLMILLLAGGYLTCPSPAVDGTTFNLT